MKKLLPLLMFLILVEGCLAATIHGTVYDDNLNVVKDVVVEVDSTPNQREVAKDGAYSFTLPQGAYTITVKSNGQTAEEKVTIEKEGDYVLDLFFFPNLDEEESLMNETKDINLNDEYFQESTKTRFVIIGVVIFLVIAGILFYFLKKRKPKIRVGIEDVKEEDETRKYLEFIKEHGGRITQKEIRKNFPISEAKISLIISELEHKGKLEKIRKGRGNVILLKK